jgi:hypothetical protein
VEVAQAAKKVGFTGVIVESQRRIVHGDLRKNTTYYEGF